MKFFKPRRCMNSYLRSIASLRWRNLVSGHEWLSCRGFHAGAPIQREVCWAMKNQDLAGRCEVLVDSGICVTWDFIWFAIAPCSSLDFSYIHTLSLMKCICSCGNINTITTHLLVVVYHYVYLKLQLHFGTLWNSFSKNLIAPSTNRDIYRNTSEINQEFEKWNYTNL